MEILHYDRVTRELLGPGVADPDPLTDGVWLIPAHAVAADVAPLPPTRDGYARVLNATGDGWEYVEDYRGKEGWLPGGAPHVVVDLGPLPEGWSEIEPPRPAAEVRAVLLARIGQRKNQMRDGGFVVSVGGEDVRWDSDTSARLAYAELAQRLTADPTFTTRWKASEGQWVDMTASLFQEVYAAGAAHIAAAFAWQEGEEARLAATPDEQLATFVVGGEDA